MNDTEPTPLLDDRFSQPGVPPTPRAAVEQVLVDAPLSWLTTVRADGRPHVTPLLAVWRDGAAYFCTGIGEQKAVNLRANPQCGMTHPFIIRAESR